MPKENMKSEPVHCCQCQFHDHDGAEGFCNIFLKWTKMSGSCWKGVREGKEKE